MQLAPGISAAPSQWFSTTATSAAAGPWIWMPMTLATVAARFVSATRRGGDDEPQRNRAEIDVADIRYEAGRLQGGSGQRRSQRLGRAADLQRSGLAAR